MPTGAAASLLGPASTQTSTKVGKKKKVGSEKPGATLSPPLPSDRTPKPLGAEQAPEAPVSRAEGPVAVIVNGHTEGPALARSTPKEPPGLPRPLGPLPCPTPQEDFPALGGPCPPRMPPPPGMNAQPWPIPWVSGRGLGSSISLEARNTVRCEVQGRRPTAQCREPVRCCPALWAQSGCRCTIPDPHHLSHHKSPLNLFVPFFL